METTEPNFPKAWGATSVHPVAAWHLWCAAQIEGDTFREDPNSILEPNLILPARIIAENPTVIENPLWVGLFVDRFAVIEERLANGADDMATCTADELVIRHLVECAEAYVSDGLDFGEMPQSLSEWMLTDEAALALAGDITSATDFTEVREAMVQDFDVDMLFWTSGRSWWQDC
jgi:hypothetical protein